MKQRCTDLVMIGIRVASLNVQVEAAAGGPIVGSYLGFS